MLVLEASPKTPYEETVWPNTPAAPDVVDPKTPDDVVLMPLTPCADFDVPDTPVPLEVVAMTPFPLVLVAVTPAPLELVPLTPGPLFVFVPLTHALVVEHVTAVLSAEIAAAAIPGCVTAPRPTAPATVIPKTRIGILVPPTMRRT
jgi:hypothetical protein